MKASQIYLLRLENQASRLDELVKVAAPLDMITNTITLIRTTVAKLKYALWLESHGEG